MKKLLSLLLAFSLCLGLSSFASAEELDLSEPVEFELMAYYVMDVPEDDAIIQYLSDMFNAKFDLTVTNIDNYDETLNMRIASGDIPDWFRIQSNTVYRQLAEDGILADVGAYAQKYNFQNIIDTCNLPNADTLTVDGVFYCSPDTTGKLSGGIYYRADWLEELNIEPPTTYEELKDCLQAIVDADPDGMGTCGFTSYVDWLTQMLPCWTGYNNYGVEEDGSIVWQYADENYKEFLKYWSDLYTSKLLDQEYFINTYEQCMEKLASGRAGFYMMNMNTTWWSNNKNGLLQYNPDAKLGALVPVPAGPAGAIKAGYSTAFAASSSFNAETDETTLSRMLGIMDYLLSQEGRELTLYGYEEGVYYDMVDGQKVQKEDKVNADWGQTLHFMGEIADFGTNDMLARDPELLKFNEYLDDFDISDGVGIAVNKVAQFTDEEATVIGAELNEISTAFRTSAYTGEIDIDAEWDAYIERLEKAGLSRYYEILSEYIEENNITLDRAFR